MRKQDPWFDFPGKSDFKNLSAYQWDGTIWMISELNDAEKVHEWMSYMSFHASLSINPDWISLFLFLRYFFFFTDKYFNETREIISFPVKTIIIKSIGENKKRIRLS